MIVAMTTDRQLPSFFGITNKYGTPYYAVVASFLFGPLAYLSLGSGGASQAFAWLQNLSTVAGLIAWATLCFAFIRFYRGCKVQGVDRDSFPWKGPFQPFTAWYGFIGSIIITLVSGFAVFLNGNWDVQDFVSPRPLSSSEMDPEADATPLRRSHPTSVSPFSLSPSSCGRCSSAARSVLFSFPSEAVLRVDSTLTLAPPSQIVRARDMDLWSGRLDSSKLPVPPTPHTPWEKFIDWLF